MAGTAAAQGMPGQDACTIAATAAFEPCCPGGGGGMTACFYTRTTYAEMCQIAACTEALNAADTACAGDDMQDNPVASSFQLLRTAVSCAGLDDPCVASVEQTMTDCQLSATLEGDPAALMNAAGVVCTEPNCVQQLQQQVGQCSNAEDFATILAVGMFTTILITCDAVTGFASQTCPDAQITQLMSACYTDAAHTTPNCPACLPMIAQMAPNCPATFLAGEPANLVNVSAHAIPRSP